jgi:hypothetical protein
MEAGNARPASWPGIIVSPQAEAHVPGSIRRSTLQLAPLQISVSLEFFDGALTSSRSLSTRRLNSFQLLTQDCAVIQATWQPHSVCQTTKSTGSSQKLKLGYLAMAAQEP